MADPDIVFNVDQECKTLIIESYQNDYLGVYQTKEEGAQFVNDVNYYTGIWLKSIKDNRYKVNEIHTMDNCYSTEENQSNLYKYCKENGIQKFANNPNKSKEEMR